MAATVSLLTLQDLYNESLVREQIDKTKTGGMTWSSAGTNTFTSTVISGSTYDFTILKKSVGNVTDIFCLDIKKDGSAFLGLQSGPLPHTERDSAVKELFETVEIIVLDLDSSLKEVLTVVQNL